MNSIRKINDKTFETDFAVIEIGDDNIIRVQGKEGVDVNKNDLILLHNWLISLKLDKYLILADRTHSYSHTFDAQRYMSEINYITALAMVVNSPVSKELAELAKDVYMKNFPVKVFAEKQDALKWLKSFA